MEQNGNEQPQVPSQGSREAMQAQEPPYSYPAWLAEDEREGWFEECPPGLNGLASHDPVVRNRS